MTRFIVLASVLLLVLSMSAFGQIIDPNVGFCNPPATSACVDAGGDPNIITSTTGFGMISHGSDNAPEPWFLFVAVPIFGTGTPSAPSISSTSGLTLNAPVGLAGFSSGDIYSWASSQAGTPIPNTWPSGLGDNSMSWVNMSAEENTKFGQTPTSFEVFLYEDNTEGFNGGTPYSFTGNLPNGVFLAALAYDGNGNKGFSTPFTTSGLEDAPGNPNGGPGGGQVPEPFSITLLATVCLFVGNTYRKRTRLN